MSSLGLPGPSNTPPGDAALHRCWNRFLDDHDLRAVFQAPSPAQIDEQCADALAALRASREHRARVGDDILRLWDRIGLFVDCLPPHVNPEWRAEEQLLKPTALRLAARRARLAREERGREREREREDERERLRGGFWDPMRLTLDMRAPAPPPPKWGIPNSEEKKKKKKKKNAKAKQESGGEDDGQTTTLGVATSLANTEYFLGHRPGDPIFSYDPRPALRPADGRNFTYRGRVPRAPGEDLLRLRILLPRVLAQLVVILAFFPERPSVVPVECGGMMGEVDGLGDGVLRAVWRCWRAKFPGGTASAAPYMHFLRSSPLVRELAWLVHRACLDEDDDPVHRRPPEEARRARRLWNKVLPVVDVLTSDRAQGTPPREALLDIVMLHVRDEDRRAREMVFGEGEYGRALLYRQGIVIDKSIHAFYASHTGRRRPTAAAAVLSPTSPHPLFPSAVSTDPDYDDDDCDDDDFFDADADPVPVIPDEVLAAYESVRARYELHPEAAAAPDDDDDDGAEADRPAPPEPFRPTDTAVVVASDPSRRRPGDKDTCAAAAQGPPRKRARR
ncbi:hypothetical protein LX36DRAFT_754465 [Colletotrichum falcatum]|nr:hypothetical protein LX36DRAFT_754465 [Colletotrichum falcatum]